MPARVSAGVGACVWVVVCVGVRVDASVCRCVYVCGCVGGACVEDV